MPTPAAITSTTTSWSASGRSLPTSVTDPANLDLGRYPALPFLRRAYELRANVPAYDAIYIALAEALDCALLTADGRLAKAPGPRCAIRLLR